MDPFTAMLRVLETMFWVAAAMVGIVYRILQFLFFFWRSHHKTPLEFPLSARFEHTHIVAGSGHGKTQLLQQFILNDLAHSRLAIHRLLSDKTPGGSADFASWNITSMIDVAKVLVGDTYLFVA